MEITIKRSLPSSKACIGRLTIVDDEGTELMKCWTLEEVKEGTARGQDLRIPAGDYKLRRHTPSQFEKTLREMTEVDDDCMINVYNDDVPADRCILIHWGNTPSDTQGCILLGSNKVNNGMIGESRKACKRFYDIMRDTELSSCTLHITNTDGEHQR